MDAAAKRLQIWHVAIVLGWLVVPQLSSTLQVWPLYLLIPLTGYAVTVSCIPPLRRSLNWLHLGRCGWDVAGATLAIIVTASTALVLWYAAFAPDLQKVTDQLRTFPFLSLVLLGIVFSVFNALLEEILFRGIFYEALVEEYGLWWALGIQGVFFGFVHAQGIPHGAVGVGMASIYGVMLGGLRQFSGGMFWPYIAHIFADATIFMILAHDMGYRFV